MITKSPVIKNNFSKNIYFTKSARIAFSYILKMINFSKEKLLIPAYIGYTDREGSGVLDPINENKIMYDFYPIKKNFDIDIDTLEKLLKNGSIKAMLLIHYFGLSHYKIVKIQDLCKKYDVLLIEDCAHTIYSKFENKYFGEFGDFSFYSLHKVLPVDEGGAFKINNKKYLDLTLDIINSDKPSIEVLEILLNYDIDLAKRKVLSNYQYMVQALKDINGIEIISPHLSQDIFPMNLPVLITTMKREKFYFKMLEEGITLIALYYKLIDTIDINKYIDSYYISNRIINFPINQDITIDEMNKIIEKTKKVLGSNI